MGIVQNRESPDLRSPEVGISAYYQNRDQRLSLVKF